MKGSGGRIAMWFSPQPHERSTLPPHHSSPSPTQNKLEILQHRFLCWETPPRTVATCYVPGLTLHPDDFLLPHATPMPAQKRKTVGTLDWFWWNTLSCLLRLFSSHTGASIPSRDGRFAKCRVTPLLYAGRLRKGDHSRPRSNVNGDVIPLLASSSGQSVQGNSNYIGYFSKREKNCRIKQDGMQRGRVHEGGVCGTER